MTDSREQLEADINRYLSQAGTDEMVTKWLDRQAAITRAECEANGLRAYLDKNNAVKKIVLDVLDSFCRAISEDGCAYKQKGFSKVYVGLIGCKKETCIVKKFADRLSAQGIEVPE